MRASNYIKHFVVVVLSRVVCTVYYSLSLALPIYSQFLGIFKGHAKLGNWTPKPIQTKNVLYKESIFILAI